MIGHVFERGLSGLVARWMLEGGADSVFARIEKAGALKPDELEKLKVETYARLEKARDEGAPYVDTVTAVWREVAGHLPDLQSVVRVAGSTLASVAARSAEIAAVRAQEMAERLAAKPDDRNKP